MPRKLLITLLLFCLAPAFAALPVAVEGQPLPSLAPMLEHITPAVVNISTSSRARLQSHPLLEDPFFRWFFESPRRQATPEQNQSLGSGVIVDAAKGLVLTNHHVIEQAEEIRVTLKDGRTFSARLLGEDPEMDVAVLQIPAENLHAVKLADSEQLRVGDFVVAIGSPFGLNQTVTSGIVSALGRSGLGIEGYENFIQTDASINPGNSGGPLVNLRGELVGINTAILAPNGGNVGIGFAIPGNIAGSIMQQIVEHGGINRGVFGITVQNLTADLAAAMGLSDVRGAVINDVQRGSAAEQAGLQAGDVIMRLDAHRVISASDLHIQLGLTRVGQQIELEVIRNGAPRVIRARIADPYALFVPGGEISSYFSGALLGEVNDQSRLGEHAAIAVAQVSEDSRAWALGLRSEDVILQVNRQRVRSLRELRLLLGQGAQVWRIKLRRGQRLITLVSR